MQREKMGEERCKIGQQVIEVEIAALKGLLNKFDDHFVTACDLILNCKGRLVVSGVGKSGHIAKKIAATFASTGTPAFFVHPSEASHGDFGMITAQDVVLALSKSGESSELIAIMPFLKRLGVKLITLTGNPKSALAKSADVNLDVTVQKEACPLDLAPTASTTAALAMGDALAMAVLDQRGFTREDFAKSHPGGALGRRLLLQVESIMHQGEAVPIIPATASVKEALVVMTQKKLGLTTIVDHDKRLLGIYTDGDVRRTLDHHVDIHDTEIATIMSKNPKTIRASMLAVDALAMMENFKITALVVTNETQQPIGVVHIHDILRAGI